MDYKSVSMPIIKKEFKDMSPTEAENYFNWYVSEIKQRIALLQNYILHEGINIELNYTPESLISLWGWYEDKIAIVEKTEEELEQEILKYPSWMHEEISKTKISYDTLKYSWDVALYFAEVMIKNSQGKIKWGYFIKPKKRVSVNEPVLLGFKGDIDLNPRLIVMTCTRRSSRNREVKRLYDIYNTWLEYIN